jgi:hydroxypyruvate reductase
MNIIRKQISQIKGGGLAAVCQPAYLHSLIISDVAGDDLYSIASAPTLPAQHNNADALALIERYSIPIPDALRDYLNQHDAAPKALAIRQDIHVIASAKISLQAAASYAEAQGLTVEIISDSLEGESGAVARMHIEHVTQLKSAPYLLLSGGETTVHVRGTGRGGNNGQFALEALKAANGAENIYGLAADTDGVDGSEDNAGAFFSPELFKAARAQGLDVDSYIANNDSYGFFEAINGLLVTGPTQTNVNDFRALYITS